MVEEVDQKNLDLVVHPVVAVMTIMIIIVAVTVIMQDKMAKKAKPQKQTLKMLMTTWNCYTMMT